MFIPAPGWISYADQATVAGATPVPVSCPENNQFKLRAADLEAAITPRTKWIVLNFPNNPTGAVCSRAEMREIADVLLAHPHVMIMADDIGPANVGIYTHGLMVPTPNIDRLAKEGMLFTDHYAEPSCTSGRAAFITGQMPIRTGLTTVGLPGSHIGIDKRDPTLAELLKSIFTTSPVVRV